MSRPNRSNLPLLQHPQELHLQRKGKFSISSNKRVPDFAISKTPAFESCAPVNAPFTWPNSSDSRRLAGIAPQWSAKKGPPARGKARGLRGQPFPFPYRFPP